ncbi:retron Ec67 family RNA-directed DNA polymerase/endonuclease [Mesorhizobium sp. M0854]|uniref:retron Ec67 family RNA-directed DNA polymerase/endonuclease n=1 Tax=Mesorhizobium sp. M0854 TaxID=2957013 RepID=UPI003339E279
MTVVSLKLEQYRKAEDITDLAKILDLKPAHISYALYKLDQAPAPSKYAEYTVPKKCGGVRTIKAPHPALKAIQKDLAKDLLEIEQVLEKTRVKKPDCILAHGFKKKLSIMTNGENHRKRRYVFNVDLKDFFPTINFGRVRGFFMKHKDFELKPAVAAVLAQIACHDNQLPQGSPCSPVISNLIASVLDIRLNELAHQYNCTYTRYADDITFSTSEKNFPAAIGQRDIGSINLWEAGPKLLKAIARAGFELNPAKTRMQLDYSRQEVTGVVVNQKVNIPADYYATVAAMCHYLFMDGECFTKVAGVKQPFPRKKLRGRLAYIYQVRGKGPKVRITPEDTEEKPKTPKPWASTKLFEKFADYADLYGIERPVLLCEGVTDNIYIKSAIQALALKYPSLTNAAGDLKIKLFKYTKTSAALQQLSGGAGELGKLAFTYAGRIKKFKSGAKHPLILIGDSDSGSQKLFDAVEKKTGRKVDGSQAWYYLGSNLYVVPIPKVGNKDTPIEQLFDQALLDTPYDGKKFDKTNAEKDGSKFYGKKVFATKVVAANKGTVNFGGFEPLLTAIAEVIEFHKTKVAPPASSVSAIASVAAAGA